jgi:hypothetical protein
MIARLFIIGFCCLTGILIVAAAGQEQEAGKWKMMDASHHQNENNVTECLCCTDKCWLIGPSALQCRDILNMTDYSVDCARTMDSLIITGGRFKTLTEANLSSFAVSLKRLTIQQSAVEMLDRGFPKQLDELDVSYNNNLEVVNWHALAALSGSLTRINLAHNKLDYIDTEVMGQLTSAGRLIRVDLSGNEWMCALNYRFTLELHEKGVLVGGEELTCQDETKRKDSWFKWNYSIIKREINKRVSPPA